MPFTRKEDSLTSPLAFRFRCNSVAWVRYPGLPEHESYERARQYFRPGLFGPVLSFGVKGGRRGRLSGELMEAVGLVFSLIEAASRALGASLP